MLDYYVSVCTELQNIEDEYIVSLTSVVKNNAVNVFANRTVHSRIKVNQVLNERLTAVAPL